MHYGGGHNSRVQHGGNMTIICFRPDVFIVHVHGVCLHISFGLNVAFVKEVSHPATTNIAALSGLVQALKLSQSAFHEYSIQSTLFNAKPALVFSI